MTSIALATCTDEATLFYDEAPLVEALELKGFTVFPVVWNSPEIDWQCYDVVLLRNTWDYHRQIAAFRAWLDFLDNRQIRVLNPTTLLRWNMDKSYLQQLAERHIKTLPTIFAKGQAIQLENIFQEYDWSEAVLKPCAIIYFD
jgi:glutathione synthase/RimK-type ligase-like ATP-grasp enzyme